MSKGEHLKDHPNFQSNGFDKRPQDTKKGGRPVGIKKEIKELLAADGRMVVKANDVVEIRENGDVVVNLTTETRVAYKLLKMTTGNGTTALRAIQMIMEHLDGKPRQAVTFDTTTPEPFDILGKRRPERTED